MDPLKIIFLVLGAIATGVVCWFIVRSNRRLNERIAELREEEASRQGAPPDPWAALAEIYAEEAKSRERPSRRSKTSRT